MGPDLQPEKINPTPRLNTPGNTIARLCQNGQMRGFRLTAVSTSHLELHTECKFAVVYIHTGMANFVIPMR
jgi:hypothetical protein